MQGPAEANGRQRPRWRMQRPTRGKSASQPIPNKYAGIMQLCICSFRKKCGDTEIFTNPNSNKHSKCLLTAKTSHHYSTNRPCVLLPRRSVKCRCSFIFTSLGATTSGCCVRGSICTRSSWWPCLLRSSTSCGTTCWAGVSHFKLHTASFSVIINLAVQDKHNKAVLNHKCSKKKKEINK